MEAELLSAREVARVVGMGEGRLSYWVRTGLIAPAVRRGGRALFGFAELVAAKAAFELTERGVSLQAVRKNLAALRGAWPAGREAGGGRAPIARLRVVSDGEQLVLAGDDVAFEPLSGQVVMDFVVGSLTARAAEVLSLPAAAPERSAWRCFRDALALDERGQEGEAEQALRQAVLAEPGFAAAHCNLGLIAQRQGRRGQALEHYQLALALEPDLPEARYNLGLLLDDGGDHPAALAAWTEVAARHPDFAPAHFNLGAALLHSRARPADRCRGRHHLLRYLELAPSGAWAQRARALLDAQPVSPG